MGKAMRLRVREVQIWKEVEGRHKDRGRSEPCNRKFPSLFRVGSKGAKIGGRPGFSLVFALAAYPDTR